MMGIQPLGENNSQEHSLSTYLYSMLMASQFVVDGIPASLVGKKFQVGLLQIHHNNVFCNKIRTMFVANCSHNPSGNKILTSIVGPAYNSKSCIKDSIKNNIKNKIKDKIKCLTKTTSMQLVVTSS